MTKLSKVYLGFRSPSTGGSETSIREQLAAGLGDRTRRPSLGGETTTRTGTSSPTTSCSESSIRGMKRVSIFDFGKIVGDGEQEGVVLFHAVGARRFRTRSRRRKC